jgi:hypothetical protein
MKYTKEEIKLNYGDAHIVYNRLDAIKQGSKYNMWEKCSLLTIPSLFPKQGITETSEFYVPFNSIGDDSTNNLSAKLAENILPKAAPFFRLMPIDKAVKGLSSEDSQKFEQELSKVERDIIQLIDMQNLRTPLIEAMKLLIVTGNTLLHKIKGGTFKVFNPRYYCVERDYAGDIISIIIKEEIDERLLPDEFIKIENKDKENKEENIDNETIYTCIYKIAKNKWVAYQEVDEQVLETTIMYFTDETMPYITLRWSALHNENYGRGLVEQHLGDLISLEGYSRLLLEGTSIAAKTILGVKPGSKLKPQDLQNAQNGDVIYADFSRELTSFQTNKQADFTVVSGMIEKLERKIGKAFLSFSSMVRDSERTTSEEIRATINELDSAFGGTFSVLAQDLQLPIIKLLLHELNPDVLKVTVPGIITGSNNVSREKDIQNLNMFIQSLTVFGPELLNTYLKIEGYIAELSIAYGIDPAKIVKTTEEIQAQQQAQAQAQQQAQAPQAPQAQQGQPTQQQ